jgi:hypothetical protein
MVGFGKLLGVQVALCQTRFYFLQPVARYRILVLLKKYKNNQRHAMTDQEKQTFNRAELAVPFFP